MCHENAVLQQFRHLLRHRRELRLALHHLVSDARKPLHKRLNRHARIHQGAKRAHHLAVVQQNDANLGNAATLRSAARRFQIYNSKLHGAT